MTKTIWHKILKINSIFLVLVIIPTFLSILYFGIFASNVFISESRFVVRSPDKPAATGLGVLLKSAGFANAGDEIYAAQDFAMSRDALRALNRGGQVSVAFGNRDISIFDRFDPMGLGDGFEDLYKFYQDKISIQHETTSSITTLKVRAFTAADAYKINKGILELSEGLVNRLNERGRKDLIQYALSEVTEAKDHARDAGLALSAFRNKAGVVDPEKQAAVQLQMISKLQDELIATKTQMSQLRAFTPENPQIEVLSVGATELAREIEDQLNKVAGNSTSLAGTAAQYQRLQLESQFADRQLAAAMTSLEEARNEARRKQAYVERIVQPNLPDEALEPRRLRGVLATFMLGLVAWGIVTLLMAGVREHVG